MRLPTGLKTGPGSERFSPKWYDERIDLIEELRQQGSLHKAKQLAIETHYIGSNVSHDLGSWGYTIRAGGPWRARKLRRYLRDFGLSSLELLRSVIEHDQRGFAASLAASVFDPPAPPVGPIGPRSRPSSFAERGESAKRHLIVPVG